MRVGAVDLGTNSTRLLVADVEDGRVTEVVRRLAITRLGEGVDESNELLPAAIARVLAVLDGYAAEAAALGTDADARGGDECCARRRQRPRIPA